MITDQAISLVKPNNALIALIDNSLWQPLSEIDHHRWIKRPRMLKGLQANEDLGACRT